jgi:hypothetical protein
MANGSLARVKGSGTVHLDTNFEFSCVLHIPGFPLNLLSISKITKALPFSVSFYHSLCIFQDLKTKRVIGMGHEVGGLYYLDLVPTSLPHALWSTLSPF